MLEVTVPLRQKCNSMLPTKVAAKSKHEQNPKICLHMQTLACAPTIPLCLSNLVCVSMKIFVTMRIKLCTRYVYFSAFIRVHVPIGGYLGCSLDLNVNKKIGGPC